MDKRHEVQAGKKASEKRRYEQENTQAAGLPGRRADGKNAGKKGGKKAQWFAVQQRELNWLCLRLCEQCSFTKQLDASLC